MRHALFKLWISCLLTACAVEVEAPDQPGAELDELALTQKRPLDHGPLWAGTRVQLELTKANPVHGFSFELESSARVSLSTLGSATGTDLDTVMSLFREGKKGASTLVASNDNHAGSVFSALTRKLAAGRYRVVVKGRIPSARGTFELEYQCSGAGCVAPEQAEDCIFGREIADIGRTLRVSTIMTMTSASQLPDELSREQLLRSAERSPESTAASPEQLFARVDGGLIRWLRIWDDRAGRTFRGFEYRIEDASYGAILVDDELDVAAHIAEGELAECNVAVAHCRLGETYRDLRENSAFAMTRASVVDASNADLLSPLEQEQLLSAVRVAYEEALDLPSALASVDQGQVNHIALQETRTGATFVAYEYGAGDNSYGGVFATDSSELVARINDGDLLDCSVLQ